MLPSGCSEAQPQEASGGSEAQLTAYAAPAEAQPQTVMAPLPRAAGLLEIDCSETRRAKGSFETRGEADFWARASQQSRVESL